MKKLNQQGFSHGIMLLLLIVVIGVASFGAWRVASNGTDSKAGNTTTSPKETSVPSKFSSKSDVTQARQALEGDDNDTSLNDTQLDKDITSLY